MAVLGVQRPDGSYVGSPISATPITPDDTLVAYGPAERLSELDQRPRGRRGEEAHHQAVAERRAAVRDVN